jgi:orotidine-5'-phosphate decarboxylase
MPQDSTASRTSHTNRIIVALDTDEPTALALAQKLQGRATWLKVGMTLYYAAGPSVVQRLKALGFKVFVDLKLHDIPHQVRGAAASVVKAGADMFTVHSLGGAEMMTAAVEGAQAAAEASGRNEVPISLAVTVLTSMNAESLASLGINDPVDGAVQRLALLAQSAGVGGVVCSPLEAQMLRELLGTDAAIVTPGVRLPDAAADDQQRVMTPQKAIEQGASHLVIGRPITAAADPTTAYEAIAASLP